MVTFWIDLPMEARMLLLTLMGLAAGALANFMIYRFALISPRRITPWGPVPDGVEPRRVGDRIPVLGWIGLSRESTVHGRGFWIRPLMIELAMPIAFCWLYWFQTQVGGLLPEPFRFPAFLDGYEATATKIFATHAILVVLMTAATFIDFDEQTIPDSITIPGTILALILASISSEFFLPTSFVDGVTLQVVPTTFDAPWFQPGRWMGIDGLWVGLAIWSAWCFSLADWRWSSAIARRRGIRRALNHFINGLFHYGYWRLLATIWTLGLVGIALVWNLNGSSWLGLFSSLLGLAVGGGVIWSIRIVASWALHMEAMGFGDVTLMAMIGSFLGWQAAVLAFFLSPFAAIVIVLVRYVITRDTYTPFGPYLCAATIWTILWWDRLYRGWFAEHLLLMGPVLLWLSAMMLGLMAVMLFTWRQIKTRLLN